MGLKAVVLFVWRICDPICYAFSSRRQIAKKGIHHNVFRVRLTRYKGKPICLSDGTHIRKNDLLLRIHLHNVLLLRELLHVKNSVMKGKHLYRMIRKSMPGLAKYLRYHPKQDEIKAIIGVTTLNRGSNSLGFETIEISELHYKFYQWMSLMPIYLLSTEKPIKTWNKCSPVYLFMPKQKLLNSYLDILS